MNTSLKVSNITKIYPGCIANDNVSLEFESGKIYALLGENGAGKTTFLNILGGIVVKNSGIVNVWGYDLDKNPRQVRSSIGIVPSDFNPKSTKTNLSSIFAKLFSFMPVTRKRTYSKFLP